MCSAVIASVEPLEVETAVSVKAEKLKKNHQFYALLARGLAHFLTKHCIFEAISASSTDHYPEEMIQLTLEPSDRVYGKPSYWSSMAESKPEVPQTLTYKLVSKLCFITEINIQPFQVIANGVSKSLCLRCCPETSCAIKAIEHDNIIEPLEVQTNGSLHYYVTRDCISEAICASGTNNYLKENIHNTLVLNGGASYWSCRGEINPDVPETLTYKLVPELRFITKIRIHLIQVIASEFSKILCLRLFPETSSVIAAIEENNIIEPSGARGLAPSLTKDCIFEAISASSTDHYPEEMIHLTLEPTDRVYGRPSYWSSLGESNPEVPETLTYKLVSKLCFITEINIQPFQVFYDDFPICSAKAVRFRVGHVRDLQLERYLIGDYRAGRRSIEDQVVWTYTSEKFPMVQENCLQNFKLPEPVLAVGGLLQIELITHVQVVGRPLRDDFVAELIDQSRKCVLKYNPETATCNN
ncbi:hypothetical protein MKW92_037054 [Papaver armeniacum]|nr:hypothetical protein MKW92_037054 [Papaver armeniacum]